ncbi:hypothetical protein PAXRUDRAFT_34422 [Paxillus rubicundulus Ve08.2h10]|uniref:Uncharacterized protein n=1 Tax=Paxillus rubicundulus Ve08.2h10 TaxID=930991 RepID=A0A0D0DUE8_9AGAM|nr:hypothetical protein PAXRUDRAFT_34422 [Paxillus rubicundulus Ve08.2h10]
MVNRRISKDLKECALTLWNHGWDLEDICEALSVSRSSCYQWREIFEEFGAVKRQPSPLHNITITPLTLLRNLKAASLTQKMLQKLASEHDEQAFKMIL